MSEGTPLDKAHAVIEHSDAARLQFFALLADTELFVLLEKEAIGEMIEPKLFAVDGQEVVLGFDSEERLAEFTGQVSAYAALPGRIVAQLLADAGMGLGLNLDVAPSSMLLGPEAMVWLHERLEAEGPGELSAQIEELCAPKGLPDVLLEALGAKLTQSAGLAEAALLAQVRYRGGANGHLLAIVGAEARAEAALARAVNEALSFSGLEAGVLDVAFFPSDAEIVARMQKLALRFEIPQATPRKIHVRAAPGSDPDKPPILH